MQSFPEKPFSNLDEQIEILKSRGLTIYDEHAAKFALSKYGYYKLINGYGEPFEIQDEHGNKRYVEGTTFDDIFAQFSIDRFVGRMIIPDILNIEERLKAGIGYVMAEEFGVYHQLKPSIDESGVFTLFPKSYLSADNFNLSNKSYDNVIEISELIDSVTRGPIAHYRKRRSHIPPWILFDGVEFGKLTRFYQVLTTKTKSALINTMLSIPDEVSEDDLLFRNFFKMLELIRLFRNSFAHNARFSASKFPDQTLTQSFPIEVSSPTLFSKSEYKSGTGKGDLFSLFVVITLFSDNAYVAEQRIRLYENRIQSFFKTNDETGVPSIDTKGLAAFYAVSGLPADFGDRIVELSSSLFIPTA